MPRRSVARQNANARPRRGRRLNRRWLSCSPCRIDIQTSSFRSNGTERHGFWYCSPWPVQQHSLLRSCYIDVAGGSDQMDSRTSLALAERELNVQRKEDHGRGPGESRRQNRLGCVYQPTSDYAVELRKHRLALLKSRERPPSRRAVQLSHGVQGRSHGL